MKVLILVAHCDKKGRSHAHKIAEASKDALLKENHEVRVVDLFNSGFGKTLSEEDFIEIHDESRLNCQVEFTLKNNFSKEIEEQLDNLEWATHVIACGPMYWLNFPAVFYSWMEKVLCAMKTRVPDSKLYNEGPNKGKKIMLCITTASPNESFSHGSNFTSIDGIFYQTLAGLYSSGFTVLRSQPFFSVLSLSDEEFKKILEIWKKECVKLDSREVLEIHREGLNEQKFDGCQQICFLSNPNLK
ncbi:hypothetical protein M9Y10_014667 [Tritrichomonas musculus]|uniref:Flavodoxin-like fold domain-containing protein n=1 Tax=Tritrichomonas musculus TaxID=1915356 RepID=A0ABR2L3D3_9EUKA